jgi:hypothetical protein
MKKTLKPSLVGAFEPIQVTGLRRHGNRTKRVTIEIESNGEVFKAKRLDIPDSPTFESRRMSDVTTAPGWLETKDVGYAVISALGKRGQFPAYEPVNDPSTILVNGKKI